MPYFSLDAQVSYQPQMAIIKMEGEINAFAEETLIRVSRQAISSQSDYILLNFSKVKYMNSTGIALVVELLAQARQANKKVLACGLSPHFQEIFEVTRLADYIKIYPDELSIFTDPALVKDGS